MDEELGVRRRLANNYISRMKSKDHYTEAAEVDYVNILLPRGS